MIPLQFVCLHTAAKWHEWNVNQTPFGGRDPILVEADTQLGTVHLIPCEECRGRLFVGRREPQTRAEGAP